MKTLALVPARSGSKGIPGKNTRDFRGKPLIGWALGIGAQTCHRTFLTTDDWGIGMMAAQHGAGVVMRPARLAQDDTPMFPVVQHALMEIDGDFDVVVLLQPTQPLRKISHVWAAMNMLENSGADSVVSVVQIPAHYSPDFAMKIEDGVLSPWEGSLPARRQDCRPAYSRDGTVYACRVSTIDKGSLYGARCLPLVIPHGESVNMDTEEDWRLAEMA